jgi:ABC-type branched-subunit amino acid transport system substrate-binding protein
MYEGYQEEPGESKMQVARYVRRLATVAAVLVLLSSALVAVTTNAGATRRVRGFDGTTIDVAGYGLKSSLPGAEYGARARIEQFNAANEVRGVKIRFVDFADDKGDPATALSEVRRLVTQEQVFALVADMSLNSPGEYISQQHVPDFGGGFNSAYCTTKPDTSVWLFGYNGCQVTDHPTVAHDSEFEALQYVQEKSGHKRPTVAVLSSDDATGKNANKVYTSIFKNGGWNLVFAEASVPPPPVGDVTPYVQQLLQADHGKAPDMIRCSVGLACLQIYTQLRAAGFKGVYQHSIYNDGLAKPFADTIVSIPFRNLNSQGIPALDTLKTDLQSVNPNQKLDIGVMYGYLSTDMFISALKSAAKRGTSGITPENVQKAAARQTWQIKNLAGPTQYPASTVAATPTCVSLVYSNGTTWETAKTYRCENLHYPIKG